MTNYILRRLIQAIPLLLGISIIIFVLIQMAPGGPLAIVSDTSNIGSATETAMLRMREKYGLNDPLAIQYLRWLGKFFQGDWGISFSTGYATKTVILERIPATLILTLSALVFTIVLSFPIGVLSALRPYSIFDYIATTFAFLGISIPSFWAGLMLIYVFTLTLGWLPSIGLYDLRIQHEGISMISDRFVHLIMPVFVLGLIHAASLTRYIRSSMLEVVNQDYVRTARAKGLFERDVIWRHALKNAAIPVVTVLALRIPSLFLGTVIIETIFAIPGIGRLYISSANSRDYPVLMGILMIVAILVIISNLLADITYGLLDPRVRYQ